MNPIAMTFVGVFVAVQLLNVIAFAIGFAPFVQPFLASIFTPPPSSFVDNLSAFAFIHQQKTCQAAADDYPAVKDTFKTGIEKCARSGKTTCRFWIVLPEHRDVPLDYQPKHPSEWGECIKSAVRSDPEFRGITFTQRNDNANELEISFASFK